MTFLYRILNQLLVVILRDVVRYRINVIRSNLLASFDYSSEHALQSDISSYYQFLVRLLCEIIAKPKRKRLEQKMQLTECPAIDRWLNEGRSVIVVLGHIGNWEWAAFYLGMKYPGRICGLYKKIKSKFIHQWMLQRRSATVNHLIDIRNTGDLIRLIQAKTVLIMMVADQNPGSDQGIIWVPFFGRETAFINGPEKLAMKYKLPVVFLHVRPTSTGGYRLEFEIISDGTKTCMPGEITRQFAMLLEKNIRDHRSQWLWSHRRWKRSKVMGGQRAK